MTVQIPKVGSIVYCIKGLNSSFVGRVLSPREGAFYTKKGTALRIQIITSSYIDPGSIIIFYLTRLSTLKIIG